MNNSSLNQFTNFQRVMLVLISFSLAFILFIFSSGLKNDSSLEKLAKNSLTPQEALTNNNPTIIEFYADWCEACKEMAPYMLNLKEMIDGKIDLVLLNVDNPIWEDLIEKYEVNGIPQMNFFDKSGLQKGYSLGVRDEDQLVEIFDALINEKDLPGFLGITKKTDLPISYTSLSLDSYETKINLKPRSHN